MLEREEFKKYVEELAKYSNFCSEMYDIVGDKILDRMCQSETIIVQLLEKLTGDEKTNWISYWLYDLDRGAKYRDGCVTTDGVNISIETVDNLYDVLYDNYTREEKVECADCICGGKL